MTSTTRCGWLARCANMATHTVYTGPSAGTVPACDSCHPEPWPHALGYPCPRPESCDRPECDGSDPAGMLRQALASVRLAVVALETLAALELRHPRRCAVCGDTLESGRHQLLPPMGTWHAFVERDGSV